MTISFNLAPGAALGEASARIEQFKRDLNMPASIITSYAGRCGGIPVVAGKPGDTHRCGAAGDLRIAGRAV